MNLVQECKCCGDLRRCRIRDFSPHAWAVLMHWEEVESEAVGKPICNSCYDDLRELLIERSGEVEAMISEDHVKQLKFVVDQTISNPSRDSSIAS